MVTISSMFGAAQPTLLAFPEQRPIFLREYSTGTYSIMPYFISKVCFEFPLAFAQSLVQWLVVYWLISFRGSFMLLLLASFALGLASASIAVLMGCAVADVKTASELLPVVFVPQMLFAGFFVSTDQVSGSKEASRIATRIAQLQPLCHCFAHHRSPATSDGRSTCALSSTP
jgi:hypothetical protein